MAQIKPVSTSMSLVTSLGQQGGKELTKSFSVPGLDVGADAECLLNSANAIATLLEHPTVTVKHSALGIISE